MEEETQSLFHWAKKMDIEQGGEDGQGRQRGRGRQSGDGLRLHCLICIIYYNNMFITKSIIRHISASTLVSQRQSITPKCFYKDFAQNLFLQSISTTKCCQRLHLHIIYYERCLTVHHGQSPVRAA